MILTNDELKAFETLDDWYGTSVLEVAEQLEWGRNKACRALARITEYGLASIERRGNTNYYKSLLSREEDPEVWMGRHFLNNHTQTLNVDPLSTQYEG